MFQNGSLLGDLSTRSADAARGAPKAHTWQPSRGDHGLVRAPEKGKLCSLFVVFFLDVFDSPSFINTCFFKEDSFVHHHAPSAQGINHGQRRTRSHMKNIYVLIVLKAWPGNWEFKGQKFYFVFLIFQEIKRPTAQRLIEIHFLLSSACDTKQERMSGWQGIVMFSSKGEDALGCQLIEIPPCS